MWRMFCTLEVPGSGAESSCPETCQLHIYLPYRIWGTGPRPPTDVEDFQPHSWIKKKAHVRHELAGREKSRLWGQKKIRPEEEKWGEGFLICWETSARETERRKFPLRFAIHRRPRTLFFFFPSSLQPRLRNNNRKCRQIMFSNVNIGIRNFIKAFQCNCAHILSYCATRVPGTDFTCFQHRRELANGTAVLWGAPFLLVLPSCFSECKEENVIPIFLWWTLD